VSSSIAIFVQLLSEKCSRCHAPDDHQRTADLRPDQKLVGTEPAHAVQDIIAWSTSPQARAGLYRLAHEDAARPGVLKRVIATYSDINPGQVMMVNWARLPARSSFQRHYHEDMQEIFVLIRGRVLMTVDDTSMNMTVGDTVSLTLRRSTECSIWMTQMPNTSCLVFRQEKQAGRSLCSRKILIIVVGFLRNPRNPGSVIQTAGRFQTARVRGLPLCNFRERAARPRLQIRRQI